MCIRDSNAIAEKLPIFISNQAIAVSAEPQQSFSVFVDRAHKPSGTIRLAAVIDELAVFELRQAVKRSQPKTAAAVKVNRYYLVISQTVFDRVMCNFLV